VWQRHISTGDKIVKPRHIAVLGGLFAGVIGFLPVTLPAAQTAKEAKPTISEETSAALLRMGQALRAEQFSFQARAIRVYTDEGGEPLHIFQVMKVTVRRPNKLLVEVTGDDGSNKLVFDGKAFTIYSAEDKKYASGSVPQGTSIDGMLKEAIGRYGIDFPLADFLSEAPNKAFLSGVTSGRVVNTVTIDGTAYDHLIFSQPPGIVLELWLPKTDQALPRRLVVTYLALPGQPNFIAEFSGWNFNIHPADAEFAFQPPADAVQVALKPLAPTAATAGKAKGGKK
jgi:hypothetical protein